MSDWVDELLQGGDGYDPVNNGLVDARNPLQFVDTGGRRDVPPLPLGAPPAAGPDWVDSLLEQPQVGVTLEGLDTERAADELRAFRPWTKPGNAGSPDRTSGSNTAGLPQWSGDELDTAADFAQRAAMATTFGIGDNLVGVFSPDRAEKIRERQQLAQERSPTASTVGDITGGLAMGLATGGLAAGATRALPLAGRVAAGAGLGAEQAALSAAGYADDGDRLAAAAEAVPAGLLLGAGGELVGTGAANVGRWAKDTAAPWLRQQGLLNRVASSGLYGGSMDRLSQNIGGEDEVARLGQWMEDRGITQLTPRGVRDSAQAIVDERTGAQRLMLDDMLAREEGPPMVNMEAIGDELGDYARAQRRSAAPTPQAAAAHADRFAGELLERSQPLTDVSPGVNSPMAGRAMEFEDALSQRQWFDDEVDYNRLGGRQADPAIEQAAAQTANSLRSGLVSTLEQQAPEFAQPWVANQAELSNALKIAPAAESRVLRETGNQPLSLPALIGGAGGGLPGLAAAVAVKTGGRSAMATGQRELARGSEFVGDMVGGLGATGARASGIGAADVAGRVQGEQEAARGYLLPQAVMSALQEGGAELGPYAQQFAEATKTNGAIVALIARLRETDANFRQRVLPRLQARTAESGY